MYSWLFFFFFYFFSPFLSRRASTRSSGIGPEKCHKQSRRRPYLYVIFRMHAIDTAETIINSCEGNIKCFFLPFFVTTFIGAELDFNMYTHQWRRREHGVQLLCELFTSCVLLPASAVMIIGWWGRGDDEGRMRVLCCLQSRVTLAWWGTPTSRSEKRENLLFFPLFIDPITQSV